MSRGSGAVVLFALAAAVAACAHRATPAMVLTQPRALEPLEPPPPFAMSNGAVEIALAYERSCARFADGTVRCWGLGFDDAPHAFPTPVASVTGAVQLAIGSTHACARTRAGRLRCWGTNESGALGDGTREGTALSATDPGLDNVSDVAVGAGFTCATTAHGPACWGDNRRGTLGLGSVHEGELRPTPAPLLLPVQSLALSGKHAFALATDGSVLGWGDGGCGLFGSGGAPKPAPFKVAALGKVSEIVSSQSHACARLEGGAVVCFGANDDGQLGDGTTVPHSGLVVALGIHDAVQLAVGERTSCARLSSGAVSCWGANEFGQLGDGTTIARAKPARVPGLLGVTHVAVGGSHACALIKDGSVQCWGSNASGELGDRTRASRSVRAPVIF